MKRILVLLLVISGLSCKTKEKAQSVNHQVNVNQIKKTVEFLSSDKLLGRKTGSEGIETAAGYIENIFTQNNIKPYFESYKDTFNVMGHVGHNIVGFIEGKDPNLKNEVVIIGAHYDHLGVIKPIDNDSIANGANDNASGTSTVLQLAQYFGKTRNNKRSLVISLFSAEEIGLVG